jgi:hypothetical protein
MIPLECYSSEQNSEWLHPVELISLIIAKVNGVAKTELKKVQ